MLTIASAIRSGNRTKTRLLLIGVVLLLLTGLSAPAHSQQFNSDNWWVLTHGVGTGVLTLGQHYSSMYLGFGFAKKWEVDLAATLYEADKPTALAHYSTTIYVKRLIFENRAQTSGLALMAGIGQSPSYLQAGINTDDFKSYWASFPLTLPFVDNAISWDIMPGFLYNREYGVNEESAWGFSYSSRLAIYKIIPQTAIVGEIFGAAGDAEADPQYKAGVRWESEYVIIALTYGDGFKDDEGGGLELGFMFFTPPYF